MAYYKIRIEIWCNWDPEPSSLDEIVANTHTGDAICTMQTVTTTVDRPEEIDDEGALIFFGGSVGDAEESTG
jgi:hypothetical protein